MKSHPTPPSGHQSWAASSPASRLRALLENRRERSMRGDTPAPECSSEDDELITLAASCDEQARIFDAALSSIVDFAYIFDRTGRFVYANKALLDLWGLSLADA